MTTRRHTLAKAGIAAVAAMLLAACSSGTTDDNGGGTDADPNGGADSPVADVVADVQQAMEPRDSFEIPSEPVDPSPLAGKTVYYIPLTAQASVFQLYGKTLGTALDAAGVNLQLCDGGANPAQIGGCIDQAIGAGAAAIVADNIPYGMAANGLDAARQAGIPVVLANMVPDPEFPADETLAWVVGPAVDMSISVADWIIADSAGQASVVLQKVTDNPSTLAIAEAAEKEFADRCPDCTVVVYEVSASNFPLVPSSTSSAILSNPDTDYVLPQFELFVQPTIGGIQQTPNAARIKIATSAASVAGLQMLADGGLLQADAAQNFAFQGWATADAIFRLAAGLAVPEYDIPFRLFTTENIGDVELTEDAEASGEWYGPTDYTDDFSALWGLS